MNIGSRLRYHVFPNSSNTKKVTEIDVIRFKDGENTLEVEARLIKKFNPIYNKSNKYLGSWSLPENFDMDRLILNIKLGMDK